MINKNNTIDKIRGNLSKMENCLKMAKICNM